ncbi:hypothetical protein SAMN04487881_1466 [Marinobacter sp. es.048]|uniref:hypothetical protein n=1 Tax=Marinobacter sp. es.048 TaxID=1761795 RepID=UPI000B587360|nr:hypothetical protein [Marinobacter sp. es.048]SNC66017.1 hypothetical protein SAMN04487881_1466 [Marinobacter sp. es.048]
MIDAKFLSTPPVSLRALELRAAADAAALPIWMLKVAARKVPDVGNGRSVFVLPGFGAGDRAMAPLRYYLHRHGFKPEGWGLGVNKAGLDLDHDPKNISWALTIDREIRGETGVPYLCDLMVERIKGFCRENGTRVSLIGWSLGGTIAREVARDLPELVDHVVTLGSPVIGGPKYTGAASYLAGRGLDLDWIEAEVERRSLIPLKPPISAIVSKTDGVVDWSAAVLPGDQKTRYITEDVAHLGMGINRRVMELVVRELARPGNQG